MKEVERKSTIHCRDSRGRIMSPSKCPKPKKKMELRYISVISSALALAVIALGVILSVTVSRNATLANSLENQYQMSLHDFAGNIESIVNNDDVALNANMAVANLAALPVKSEHTTDTIAILNTVAKEGTADYIDELRDLQTRLANFGDYHADYRIVDNLNDSKRKQRVTELDKVFSKQD